MRRSFQKIIFPTLGVLSILLLPFPASAVLITDLRLWSAPDHTRVVLDLTEPVRFKGPSQETSTRNCVELLGAMLFTKKRELATNDPFVSKISLTQEEGSRVRLVVHQRKVLNVSVFSLKPYLDKPHRLVIDLIDPTQETKQEEERKKQKEIRPRGAKTVVIDPGHGGEDPGAIGTEKTMEKDVVLKIGTKLFDLLGQGSGIQAFLTRKADYFVPLPERLKIARDYGAELFVSLHADGSFNPQARGSSIYCLSLSGATDEAAKILADKENMSDVLGGALPKPAIGKDPSVNQILLDLMQNNSMKESFRFADYLLENVQKVNSLKYASYRQANFIVLRAPNFPSALVEMAFITNKNDERLLCQDDFQDKMAQSLATSIKKYFSQ